MGRHRNKPRVPRGERKRRQREREGNHRLSRDHFRRVCLAQAMWDPTTPEMHLVMPLYSNVNQVQKFSNHALTPLWFNGVWFRTSEHAYQYQKALAYELSALADMIATQPTYNSEGKMLTKPPLWEPAALTTHMHHHKQIKMLDRTQPQFRQIWEANKLKIMRKVVSAKFRQNPNARERLLATQNFYLAEASIDTFWGAGYFVPNPKLFQPPSATNPWRGENHLGRVLMDVREMLVDRLRQQRCPQLGLRSLAIRAHRLQRKIRRRDAIRAQLRQRLRRLGASIPIHRRPTRRVERVRILP
jgi:ribA/ribD-fused uncharacterized protein